MGQFGTRSLSAYSGLTAINSSESVLLAVENFNRINITIQNTSTAAALIKLRESASSTSYNFVLGADTTLKSGNGGNIKLLTWKGSLYGVTLSTGSHYLAVTEEIENT